MVYVYTPAITIMCVPQSQDHSYALATFLGPNITMIGLPLVYPC